MRPLRRAPARLTALAALLAVVGALPAGRAMAQSRVEIPVGAGPAYQAFLRTCRVVTEGRLSLTVAAGADEAKAMLGQAKRAVAAIESLFVGMRRRTGWERLTVWCIDDRSAFLGAVRAVANADAGNAGGMCCHRGKEVHVFVHGRNWRLMRHELWHAVSGPFLPAMDPWLDEGMAEILGESVDIGESLAMGGASADRLAKCRALVSRGAWVSLPIFLQRGAQWGSQLRQGLPTGSDQYLQAWAIVHHLMFADNGAHRPMLATMMAELNAGRDQRSALHSSVGSSPASLQAWEREITSWLGSASPVDLAGTRRFLADWAESERSALTMGIDELGQSVASHARRGGLLGLARSTVFAGGSSEESRASQISSIRIGPVDGGIWTVRWQVGEKDDPAKPVISVGWVLR
jgi:hypothetical protein